MASSAAPRSVSGSPGEPRAASAAGLSSPGVAGVPSLVTTFGPLTCWACGLPVFGMACPPMSSRRAASAAGARAPRAKTDVARRARRRGSRCVIALISFPRLESLEEGDQVGLLVGLEAQAVALRTDRVVEVHDVLERGLRGVVHVRAAVG